MDAKIDVSRREIASKVLKFASSACKIAPMKSWDDLRFVLAVSRTTSIKKAANSLGVNRSTVLRRLNAYEKSLGVRLFERLPSGYFPTPAGEEVVGIAEEMEELVGDGERRVAGQDIKLKGQIRVSVSATLLSYVLIPPVAEFVRTYPDIELEIVTTFGLLDLARREADVAIRISDQPPEELVGRRVAKVARAVYDKVSSYNEDTTSSNSSEKVHNPKKWIGWSPESVSSPLISNSNFSDYPVKTIITDPNSTVEAIVAGLGISILPCYIGDQESEIRRVSPERIELTTDLWVLTHKDLRNVARIRAFVDFISTAIEAHKSLLEGNSPRL